MLNRERFSLFDVCQLSSTSATGELFNWLCPVISVAWGYNQLMEAEVKSGRANKPLLKFERDMGKRKIYRKHPHLRTYDFGIQASAFFHI